MADTHKMRIRIDKESSIPLYIIKEIKLIMAAGITPAAIFFMQKESFPRVDSLEYTPESRSLR